MEMANPSFFKGNVSLNTPESTIRKLQCFFSKNHGGGFFPMDELTNSLPKQHIMTSLPNHGTCANSICKSASHPCLQNPPSISRSLLKNWQRNPTSSGCKTANGNINHQLVFQLLNSIPTIQILPNFCQVFSCANSKIYLEGMIQITPQPNPPTHFHAAINWMILIEWGWGFGNEYNTQQSTNIPTTATTW